MGFLKQTTNVTLTAKLTPFGRQQLLLNTSSMITQFSLGDSDANYYGDAVLENIPSLAGELGANDTFSNGLYSGNNIKTPIIVNALGDTKKLVQAGSSEVVITPVPNGLKTISADTLTQIIVDRTLGDTDGNTNLFHSFGLPITQADKDLYTTFTTSNGGYLDTAISNINQDKVLVIAIDECEYGEVFDGKTVYIELESSGVTSNYSIYSTFQKSLTPATTMDSKIVENQSLGVPFGDNVALLFSDQVVKPNSNSSKSWATGHGTSKAFSLNGKEQFNETTVPSTSTNVDHAIGIAYLSKGIMVITHPDIVDNYDTSSGGTTTITFNHISNEIAQNVTCIVERDEFADTTNVTRTDDTPIRVSEVALYDASNNMIAMAKSNQQVLIGANQFMALGVRILV